MAYLLQGTEQSAYLIVSDVLVHEGPHRPFHLIVADGSFPLHIEQPEPFLLFFAVVLLQKSSQVVHLLHQAAQLPIVALRQGAAFVNSSSLLDSD